MSCAIVCVSVFVGAAHTGCIGEKVGGEAMQMRGDDGLV